MDREAFELGYLIGLAVSKTRIPKVVGATRRLEETLRSLVEVDRAFVTMVGEPLTASAIEEMKDLLELPAPLVPYRLPLPPSWPFRRYAHYSARDLSLPLRLLLMAEFAGHVYDRSRDDVAAIQALVEAAGWHEAIRLLVPKELPGYGREREEVPPDVRRLAQSLGMSFEDALELLGGKITPHNVLRELREAEEEGGPSGVFHLLLEAPNPFRQFLQGLREVRVQLNRELLRRMWPRREGWGGALGGVVLAGADIVTVVETAWSTSPWSIAAAIQAAYSVPEGLARMRRGVRVMRQQSGEAQ